MHTSEAAPATGADVLPKISLSCIQWVMPHVLPSDGEKLQLQKLLLQNKKLEISFRSLELHEYASFPSTKKHTWAVQIESIIHARELKFLIIASLKT